MLRAAYRLGVAKASWLGDYYRHCKTRCQPAPAMLAEQGALLAVQVEGENEPWYLHPARLPLLQQAEQLRAAHSTLLSPFDPLVWDRRRALELFNFDYRIECYTPAPQRRFGYFCLPILRRGALIGRLDAKAHRSEGVFAVLALHLENGVKVSAALLRDLAQVLAQCARWHACSRVSFGQLAHGLSATALQQEVDARLRPGMAAQGLQVEEEEDD